MKPAKSDPRHLKRVKMMQDLFSYAFISDDSLRIEAFLRDKKQLKLLIESLTEIDKSIEQFANERPLQEINQVDLAILRLIIFESQHKETPKKVLINEAVELAKEFGTETSPKFVNGVLGKLLMKDKKGCDENL